jgi:hypothetical protein
MESFIVISASMIVDGAEVTKEVITHAKTFNYKVTTAPAGFPVIVEERICMESPCIVAQMGATNPSFIVQTVNAKEDNIYLFAGWTATDTMTGQVKVVNNTNYEEVAVSDNLLVANYKPVPYVIEPALGSPQVTIDTSLPVFCWNAPVSPCALARFPPPVSPPPPVLFFPRA